MTWMQWFYVFLLANVWHFLMYWKFYKRAGYPAWAAIVPFYNLYVLTKIINRPWWWMLLLLIPVVNLLMIPTYWFQVLEVFGKNTARDKILALVTLGVYIMYLNFTQAEKLPYRPEHDQKETLLGVVVFAVVAATLVHTFGFQPFVIPSSSLENTLLTGDYLIVSKLHYGPRVPMTTLQVPMLHDTIPLLKIRSYLPRPQLPYMRLPGFQKIKRFDLVVFNWPADTVQQFFKISHQRIRKPIDKKSNYVKRCVGLPGDTIEVKAGILYVNGKPARYPDRTELKHEYFIRTKKGLSFSRREWKYLFDKFHIYEARRTRDGYLSNLTRRAAEAVKAFPETDTVYMALDSTAGRLFGNPRWSFDFYGPLYIPKKGDKVILTRQNYPVYKKLLEEYETLEPLTENKVEWKNNSVYINGRPVKEYTFKQDYYWMMGDNRSHSEDSRVWGFVPWTHIVGKPVLIWFSKDNITGKIRWDRVMTTVSGKGKRVSYLWYVLALVALALVWPYLKKRKRNA